MAYRYELVHISLLVALVVVGTALTADNCAASHLRNTTRLTLAAGADILARSSDKEVVALVQMIEVEPVCYSLNASRAKQLPQRSQNRPAPQ